MTDPTEALALADEYEKSVLSRLRDMARNASALHNFPIEKSSAWEAADLIEGFIALRSQSPAPAPVPDESQLREEIENKALEIAWAICIEYRLSPETYAQRGGEHPIIPVISRHVEPALAEERAKREAAEREVRAGLCAVLHHFGPEGAQKVTSSMIEARSAVDRIVTPTGASHEP